MNPTLSEREMETMKEMNPVEALPPHHQTQREEVLKNEGNFANPICLGVDKLKVQSLRTPVVSSPPTSSENSVATLNLLNCSSSSHPELLEESQCPNGNTSSRVKPLILTKSCCHSITFLLMRRERLVLEIQRLALAQLKRKGKLKQALNGLPLGDPLCERLASCMSIENRNWPNMGTTSNVSSLPSVLHPMGKSSCLIGESETRSEEVKRCSSPTINTSRLSMPLPSRMMESSTTIAGVQGKLAKLGNQDPKSVCGSMVKPVVVSRIPLVNIDTHVSDAVKQGMVDLPVTKESEVLELGSSPKYLRYNLWAPDLDLKLTAAEWTLSADPLPRPPQEEFDNLPAWQTIRDHPDLF